MAILQKKNIKKMIIYDLDGTLVDSAITVTDILNSMRRRLKKSALEPTFVRPFTALGGEALIKMALDCDDSKVAAYLNEFRQIYASLEVDQGTMFSGVIETLQSLKDSGFKLAMCTNKPRDLAIKTLKTLKLTPFFDFTVCGGDVEQLKPSPDPILKITRALNIQVRHSVFVGDTIVDYSAATACDMDFLFYDSGYDKMLNEVHNLVTIHSHIDILQHVNSCPEWAEK